MLLITPPFPIYTDRHGEPLDNGYVYFGIANTNPQTNPVAIFWDEDLSIPAAQPARTTNGYIVRNGTPTNIYTASTCSMTVRDRNGTLVYSSPVVPALAQSSGSESVGF